MTMRFRVWVNGQLLDEAWVDSSSPAAEQHIVSVRAHHLGLTAVAERRGDPWLVEIYDPAMPDHRAYFRAGTDAAGMVDPQPVGEL